VIFLGSSPPLADLCRILRCGTVSQGETIEETLANLKEVAELYLAEFPIKEALGNPW